MNNIITVQNVRGYLDENGTAWLNAGDIVRMLGWTRTEIKNGKEYTSILWHRVNAFLGEFDFRTDVCEKDYLPENICYLLAMKANNEVAKKFQLKIANEILPAIRRTGSYSVRREAPTPCANMVIDVQATADAICNLITGVQRGIAIAQAIDIVSNKNNLPLDGIKLLLPPAEHETGYLNATQIGERLGLGTGRVAAVKANKLLAQAALQVKEGKVWRLTDEGTAYGEELPYTNNGHSGYHIQWNDNVIDLLNTAS